MARLLAGVTSWSLEQPRSSGLLVFTVVKDCFEGSTFHTWERYASNAAMARHTTSPTFAGFMEQVGQACTERSLRLCRASDQVSISCLAACVLHVAHKFTAPGAQHTHPAAQVNPFLEQPIALALYEWQDGALGPVSMSVGAPWEFRREHTMINQDRHAGCQLETLCHIRALSTRPCLFIQQAS